jgi:ferredoxin
VPESAKTIPITFIRRNGEHLKVMAAPGQNLLRVAQDNDVELEGACECSVACSTCHVILEKPLYDRLPEASEDEEDMLDMAFGLTETSRLGCQVIVDEKMKDTVVTLPKATRNFYVDGHKPKPH